MQIDLRPSNALRNSCANTDLEASAVAPVAPSAVVPRDRLSIGVTGHRLDRLGTGRVESVAVALAALFARIGQAAQALGPADIRVVTSLADGADSIAADAALARNWVLDVVLPFFRGEHMEDFADGDARDRYEAQLAACAAVMELPGDRAAPEGRGVAYERAGRVVLAQSDVLVAVWDGGPSRGRGGAPQIIAEAVLLGVPVIHIDPTGGNPPALLWDGLEELDLGQQTVETVARGGLDDLPGLIRDVLHPAGGQDGGVASDRVEQRPRRRSAAFAYPLLLAVMGVRRPRRADARRQTDPVAAGETVASPGSAATAFADRIRARIAPRFARADAAATRVAMLFRSVYVANFVLAAAAVILSLFGLVLPASAKPALIALEVIAIAVILIQTRMGNRAAWHRSWLDNRALAERLRCLAISAQLGDLNLRGGNDRASAWVGWYACASARDLGLPAASIDADYLRAVRGDLLALIDDQIAYLSVDSDRMHRLDHRLHRLGTIMFGATVLTCIGLLMFKAADAMVHSLEAVAHPLTIAGTIVSAALPAVGAAIYGIRMQGDFAGIAERDHALAAQLKTLRGVIVQDTLTFDTLSRRVRRVTGLLTDDLSSWLRIYHARPLALPG